MDPFDTRSLRFTRPMPVELTKGLEPGDEFVPVSKYLGLLLWVGQGRELMKGAGHKYLRRVPDGRGGWRYFYNVAGGGGLGHHDEMQAGAKFKLAHNGQAGHFEVHEDHGDHVTIRHDESGHETRVSKKALRAMLHKEHAQAVTAHTAKVKEDLAAVAKHGTAAQKQRLQARADKYGHTRHLLREQEKHGKTAEGHTRSGREIPHVDAHGDERADATEDWGQDDHDDAARHHAAAARGAGDAHIKSAHLAAAAHHREAASTGPIKKLDEDERDLALDVIGRLRKEIGKLKSGLEGGAKEEQRFGGHSVFRTHHGMHSFTAPTGADKGKIAEAWITSHLERVGHEAMKEAADKHYGGESEDAPHEHGIPEKVLRAVRATLRPEVVSAWSLGGIKFMDAGQAQKKAAAAASATGKQAVADKAERAEAKKARAAEKKAARAEKARAEAKPDDEPKRVGGELTEKEKEQRRENARRRRKFTPIDPKTAAIPEHLRAETRAAAGDNLAANAKLASTDEERQNVRDHVSHLLATGTITPEAGERAYLAAGLTKDGGFKAEPKPTPKAEPKPTPKGREARQAEHKRLAALAAAADIAFGEHARAWVKEQGGSAKLAERGIRRMDQVPVPDGLQAKRQHARDALAAHHHENGGAGGFTAAAINDATAFIKRSEASGGDYEVLKWARTVLSQIKSAGPAAVRDTPPHPGTGKSASGTAEKFLARLRDQNSHWGGDGRNDVGDAIVAEGRNKRTQAAEHVVNFTTRRGREEHQRLGALAAEFGGKMVRRKGFVFATPEKARAFAEAHAIHHGTGQPYSAGKGAQEPEGGKRGPGGELTPDELAQRRENAARRKGTGKPDDAPKAKPKKAEDEPKAKHHHDGWPEDQYQRAQAFRRALYDGPIKLGNGGQVETTDTGIKITHPDGREHETRVPRLDRDNAAIEAAENGGPVVARPLGKMEGYTARADGLPMDGAAHASYNKAQAALSKLHAHATAAARGEKVDAGELHDAAEAVTRHAQAVEAVHPRRGAPRDAALRKRASLIQQRNAVLESAQDAVAFHGHGKPDPEAFHAWAARRSPSRLVDLAESVTGAGGHPAAVELAFGKVPAHDIVRAAMDSIGRTGTHAQRIPPTMRRAVHALGHMAGEHAGHESMALGAAWADLPDAVLEGIKTRGRTADGKDWHPNGQRKRAAENAVAELRARDSAAARLGVPRPEVQPKVGIEGTELSHLAAGMSDLRKRASAGDKHAQGEIAMRGMAADLLGHGKHVLDSLHDHGGVHEVFGGDHEHIKAPDGSTYRRNTGHAGETTWKKVGADGTTGESWNRGASRAALEKQHGTDGWGDANETKEQAHGRLLDDLSTQAGQTSRTPGRKELSGYDKAGIAIRQHLEGSKLIAHDEHGPVSLGQVAELMDRHQNVAEAGSKRENIPSPNWAQKLSDERLGEIVKHRDEPGLHDRFHREQAARADHELHQGDHGDHEAAKSGNGWTVKKGGKHTGIKADTKGEALHAAGMLHRGDSAEDVTHALVTGTAKRAVGVYKERRRQAAAGAGAASLHAMTQATAPAAGEFNVEAKPHTTRAKAAARMAKFASTEESRANLQSYHVKDGHAHATDGHRMASIPVKGDHEDGATYRAHGDAVPKAIENDSAKVAEWHKGWGRGSKSDVEFPDYTQVIPKGHPHVDHVDAGHLKTALRMLKPHMAGQVPHMRLERKEGKLYATADVGHAVVGGVARIHLGDTSHPDGTVGVNHKYLSDAVQGSTGTVQIKTGSMKARAEAGDHALAPMAVHREDGERHIIMPLRV